MILIIWILSIAEMLKFGEKGCEKLLKMLQCNNDPMIQIHWSSHIE